jgi:serine protease AprX
MGKAKHRVRGIGVLLLTVLLLGTIWVQSAGAAEDSKKLHPQLNKQADSSNRQPVDVIVSFDRSTGIPEIEAAAGAKATRRWSLIHAVQLRVPANRLQKLASLPGVTSISPNSPMRPSATYDVAGVLSHYQAALKLDPFWTAGFLGQGIGVAVIDSGVAQVPALQDHTVNVTVGRNNSTQDAYGHGTHVAGIIAADAGDGLHVGVAPRATIYNLRVTADDGSATEGDIVTALDWIYSNHRTYNIRVANISMQSGVANDYTTSPLDAAVERLWFDGVVVVVSSGNRGTDAGSEFYPPANDPFVITVGAMDDLGTAQPDDDAVIAWSSQGLTQQSILKPDLLAPGRRILSTLAPGSTLGAEYPQFIQDGSYIALSGSSMAAPTISGTAALMLNYQPSLQPDQVKFALTASQRAVAGQPPGGPGAPDGNVLYSALAQPDSVGYANQGLTPSPLLATTTQADGTAQTNVSYLNVSYLNVSYLNVSYLNAYYLNVAPDKQYYGQ